MDDKTKDLAVALWLSRDALHEPREGEVRVTVSRELLVELCKACGCALAKHLSEY